MIGSEMCPCGCGLTATEARINITVSTAALDAAVDRAADQAREVIQACVRDVSTGEEEAARP